MKIDKASIILAGLAAHFPEAFIPEVYFVDFKNFADIPSLMKTDDFYSYCEGGSHDTYKLMALYENGQQVGFKNSRHQGYGAEHEPDRDDEGDDLEEFLRQNLEADCFLLHHSHAASWENDELDVEDLSVILPSEREKRKFLFTLRKQYRSFIAEINSDLLGHAGDDEYVSVLVPVAEKERILRVIKEGGV